jgi:hypothetical protein
MPYADCERVYNFVFVSLKEMRFAYLLLVASFALVSPVASRDLQNHELEIRYGPAQTCGTCAGQHLWQPMAKADALFQGTLNVSDDWILGGYGKASVYDHIFQGASGFLLGWNLGLVEARGYAGIAYAGGVTERVRRGFFVYDGQTRATYDLGVSLRYPVADRWRLTLNYAHNSNGEDIGMNFTGLRRKNPGIDCISFGVSYVLGQTPALLLP